MDEKLKFDYYYGIEAEHYQDENEIKKSRLEQEMLGSCPKCGSDIKKGKYGPYCIGKCGMKLS